MSALRFLSSAERMQYFFSCEIKCKIDNRIHNGATDKAKSCPGKYKDCTNYGGYDPADPCH